MNYWLILVIVVGAVCYGLHGLFVMTDEDDDA